MKRHRRKRILVYVLLIPSAIVLTLPILWLFILSFRPNSVIRRGIESITSTQFVLENFVTLFTHYNVLRFLSNSVIVTLVVTCLSVLVALLAGYSLVRFRFRGRGFFYSLPLFSQIVPTIQLVVPFYTLMLITGLLNTRIALILSYISLVLPISVWMMIGYLEGVLWEIEDAAMIDGCSRLGAIFRVVIPIAMPGIAATFMVAALMAWDHFLFAFVLTSSEGVQVLAVAVYNFLPQGNAPTAWGLLFAISVVFLTPALMLFALLQNSFRKGLSLGSLAGR
jgi:ABC-type glycerol-3-phosphate transport system permease component